MAAFQKSSDNHPHPVEYNAALAMLASRSVAIAKDRINCKTYNHFDLVFS